MACFATDFKTQFLSTKTSKIHHDLTPTKIKQHHATATKIKDTIASHGNPFSVEGNSIHNLITHACIPDDFVQQILNINKTGQKLYEDYVAERINGNVSIWDPVKKEKNMMYMSGNKKLGIKIREKNIELKETKDLFGRLMILSQSNREIDQKQAISNFDFTLTPRSLFTTDGEILPCTEKSKLIQAVDDISAEEQQNTLESTLGEQWWME